MADIPIHPLERWRREQGLTQRQVAAKIYSGDQVISKAERGVAVSGKFIDRLIALTDHVLKRGDFAEFRGKSNGTRRKRLRPKALKRKARTRRKA